MKKSIILMAALFAVASLNVQTIFSAKKKETKKEKKKAMWHLKEALRRRKAEIAFYKRLEKMEEKRKAEWAALTPKKKAKKKRSSQGK